MTKINTDTYIGGFLRTTQALAKQTKGFGVNGSKPTSYVSQDVQDQISILSGRQDSLAQALTKGVSEQKFTSLKDYGAYVVKFFKDFRSGAV